MALSFYGSISVNEDLAACYTVGYNSYIWHAVDLGYMTNDEWQELVRSDNVNCEVQYHELRGMMAMFVLLAMGEEL